VVGSVDDGKSTLIGRLLHDTASLDDDTLAALQAASVRSGMTVDFSLVTDGLKAEREQKITIDVAYRYFSTPRRSFIIADTPGHEQYTRNMVTGASTADLAVILVDAQRGVLVQTKRHSFIASLLGIPRLIVAVNKMDLVEYSQAVFERIAADYREFASRLGVLDLKFMPIDALHGDNLVERSARMPWYRGEPLIGLLESVYVGSDRNLVDFRLPVQCVLRPDAGFRGFAGQIASGVVRVGDPVLALPSQRASRIRSIFGPEGECGRAFAPMSISVTLEDEIDLSRGDMLVHVRNVPRIQTRFECMLVWMTERPMEIDRSYVIKHTTRSTRVLVRRVDYRVDVNTLSRATAAPLQLNEIGRVLLEATGPLFLDPYARNRATGGFILIDPLTNATVAAGMVIDRLSERDLRPATGDRPKSTHVQREPSRVTEEERTRLLSQRALTIWMTGLSGSGKSSIARDTEWRLHREGRHVYVLDGDNLRFGLNRDLSFSPLDRSENVRRIAEVARLLNDAGAIVIVPVISPFQADREGARCTIGAQRFIEVHVATPLEVCEQRDVKGLYRRARAGEIEEFTGISSPYEAPEAPFLRLDTSRRMIADCVEELLARIRPLIAV
jgi:bifunctional enzyme CysN/CysC